MVVIVSPPLASSAYLSRDFAAGSNSYCGGDREALADGRRGVARAPKQSVSARAISGPPALSEMGPQASMVRPIVMVPSMRQSAGQLTRLRCRVYEEQQQGECLAAVHSEQARPLHAIGVPQLLRAGILNAQRLVVAARGHQALRRGRTAWSLSGCPAG